jgi:hypothetical protein
MPKPNLYRYAAEHDLTFDQVKHMRDDLNERLRIKVTQPSSRADAGWNEIELSAVGKALAEWIATYPELLVD